MRYATMVHKNKHNGYIDLKTGGWGVDLHSKTAPKPGDRIFIFLDDGNFVEEFVDSVLNEYRDHRGHINYTVSIQSQDQVNQLILNDWKLPTP